MTVVGHRPGIMAATTPGMIPGITIPGIMAITVAGMVVGIHPITTPHGIRLGVIATGVAGMVLATMLIVVAVALIGAVQDILTTVILPLIIATRTVDVITAHVPIIMEVHAA